MSEEEGDRGGVRVGVPEGIAKRKNRQREVK